MQIVEYRNNKSVLIKFLETGEYRRTTYAQFAKGGITANLIDYPVYSKNKARSLKKKLIWLAVTGICVAVAVIYIISSWTR